MEQPRTSLAGILIAVTAIALALGFWINVPSTPHLNPVPTLVAITAISFCCGLVTPYRWIGILIGTVIGMGWAQNWRLKALESSDLFVLVAVACYAWPPMIVAAFAGSWLRRRLSVQTAKSPSGKSQEAN